MRLGVYVRKTDILRVAALTVIAFSTSACSSIPTPSVPDWMDPTTWLGDDNPAPDGGQTPDLASIPDKPNATTPDNQAQVAESLDADRTHAKYSAEKLRGGTETAAAPPPDVPIAKVKSDEGAVSTAAASRARTKAEEEADADASPVRTAHVDRSVAQNPTGRAMAGTLPPTPPVSDIASMAPSAPAAEPVPAAEPAPAVSPPAPQTAVAAAKPPVTAAPAPAPVRTAMINPSDAALGFKPSKAPPLDPSISQFVAAPIVQHYERTAAQAGIAYAPAMAAQAPRTGRHHRNSRHGVGGPEHMSGAVVANLNVLGEVAANPAPSLYKDAQGIPATAVVFFRGDSVHLNAAGRAQVRAAVEAFKAGGGHGYVRVVGHAASRTPNMSVARHVRIIFRKSQQRADAVAKALIRRGVPADKVLVQAVGDSEPIYYESMPKGEEGNRRAEIYVQG